MKLIKEIYEQEIGIRTVINPKTQYSIRKAARIVLLNDTNQIAILNVTKDKYHKLPGGGIEIGEDIETALLREVREEVGATAKINGEIGMTIEYREQHNLLQISYCYYGEVIGEVKEPEFTEIEINDGFELQWMELDNAIKLMENDEPETYLGKFIRVRDLSILKSIANLKEGA